jgi:hypothetical protein
VKALPILKNRVRILALSVPALLLGCGPGVGSGLGTEPAAPSVVVGERLEISFVSDEPLKGEPEWELVGLHAGGLLGTRGRTVTYIAPEAAGAHRLVVRAQRADGSPARLVQTVQVLPQTRLEPPSTTIRGGATVHFTIRIKGLPRGTVTWKVDDPEGGAITPEGLYTAPARPGVYRVTATSTEDPAVTLSAVVTVY